jgi:hypothetical protein
MEITFTEIESKPKKITFEDILSNMSLVVNKHGVLLSMMPIVENQNQNQNQPISIKPVYNNYFYDSNTDIPIPDEPVIQTQEEYNQLMLENKIKQRHIAETKSKKLIFMRNIQSSPNGLRTMNFR